MKQLKKKKNRKKKVVTTGGKNNDGKERKREEEEKQRATLRNVLVVLNTNILERRLVALTNVANHKLALAHVLR